MADNAIEAKIGANVEGFRRGATEAKEHVDSLIQGLRDFKSEQVSQARTARFFVSELLEIVPAADGAKSAIQGLIGIALSGGGMAGAFEGALFIAKQLGAVWHDNGDTIKKATEDAAAAITALDEKIKAYIASTTKETEAEKLRREVIRPLEEEAARQKTKLIALTDKQAEAQDKLNRLQQAHVVTRPLELGPLAAQIKEAAGALALLEAKLANANVELGRILSADKTEQAKKNIADYAASVGKATDEQMAQDEKLATEDAKRSQEWIEMKKKQMDEYFASIGKATDEQIAQDEKAARAVAEAATKRIADHAKFVKGMVTELGSAFSQTFKAMVRGTMDLGDALKNLGLGVVDMIIDALVKLAAQAVISAIIGKSAAAMEAIGATAGYTATAIAGAAASQAFIPFAGPALASAAAAEMAAMLGALTGPLLAVASAAGGMMVPHDMLAMVHEDERILPAKYSEGLDNLVMGGGGAVQVHLTINAIDGQSVDRFVKSYEFVRAMRDAVRQGRM